MRQKEQFWCPNLQIQCIGHIGRQRSVRDLTATVAAVRQSAVRVILLVANLPDAILLLTEANRGRWMDGGRLAGAGRLGGGGGVENWVQAFISSSLHPTPPPLPQGGSAQ